MGRIIPYIMEHKNVSNHQPMENMPLERGVPVNAKFVYSPNN